MADPTLKRASVAIKYTASDGYHAELGLASGDRHGKTDPELAILDGIRELSRLAALFGFEAQARERFEEAASAVREWREVRHD